MPRGLIVGALLIVFGLASWSLYVKQSGDEPHAYARAGDPPTYVQLAAGDQYFLSIRGGVNSELRLGIDPTALQCTAARPGQGRGALRLLAEQSGTKAMDAIASFVSAISGRVHIECTGIDAVFVDDAADSPFDSSGLWLVLASAALAAGLPLTLSGLRRAGAATAARQSRADSAVECVDPSAEEVL